MSFTNKQIIVNCTSEKYKIAGNAYSRCRSIGIHVLFEHCPLILGFTKDHISNTILLKNQDPTEKTGLVQLTILSPSYRLLKIEFHE